MRCERRERDGRVLFVLKDVDPKHVQAVRDLGYAEEGGEFSRFAPVDAPHVESAYRNFVRRAEAMVLQRSGGRAVPWEPALRAFLARVRDADISWALVGSAALAVRGIDVRPCDVDLLTDVEGAHRLGDALADDLVEPVTEWSGMGWFARAFLGARVEWLGSDQADVRARFVGPGAETIAWGDAPIAVAPLEVQLAIEERRGNQDRVSKIRRLLGP